MNERVEVKDVSQLQPGDRIDPLAYTMDESTVIYQTFRTKYNSETNEIIIGERLDDQDN